MASPERDAGGPESLTAAGEEVIQIGISEGLLNQPVGNPVNRFRHEVGGGGLDVRRRHVGIRPEAAAAAPISDRCIPVDDAVPSIRDTLRWIMPSGAVPLDQSPRPDPGDWKLQHVMTVDTPSKQGDLLRALKEIAERAGETILAVYSRGADIRVETKADDSPVTEADDAAEAVILEASAGLRPEIPIVSEEACAAGHRPTIEGARFWLVDPLDGTKEFLSRNGEFTVNIALIERGIPVMGVVHAPALATTWCGAKAADAEGTAQVCQHGMPARAISAREVPADGATVIASRRHGSGRRSKRSSPTSSSKTASRQAVP